MIHSEKRKCLRVAIAPDHRRFDVASKDVEVAQLSQPVQVHYLLQRCCERWWAGAERVVKEEATLNATALEGHNSTVYLEEERLPRRGTSLELGQASTQTQRVQQRGHMSNGNC